MAMCLQAEVRLNVLAYEMYQKTGTHDRKRYVSLAIANIEMAARDSYRIVPDLLVQMNSNHRDTAARQMQVKLEASNEPALLSFLQIKLEGQFGIRLEFYRRTHQFLTAIRRRT